MFKKKIDYNNVFHNLKSKIMMESADEESYLPNIIEFCESSKYLNLSGQGINLYPVQKIILKTFYRGQKGNETLQLTDEDMQILQDYKLDNVINKYNSEYLFRELVLILGRRSGKDFITSLMALYEAMWLLEVPGGSPFSYYNIATGNPIHILTVATSAPQASILFKEIKTRIQFSPYFKSRIGKIESDRIYLLTPEDKDNNKKLIDDGMDSSVTPGNVVVLSGHSNSEGLLGYRCFALLLDEVASFKTTTSALSGDRIYSALAPSTADFRNPHKFSPDTNSKDYPDGLYVLDSKIISISSPRAEEGILYRLYKEANETPERLVFKLPTWKVNIKFPEQALRREFKLMGPAEFAMEFGAEFSGVGGEMYIPDKYVDEAMEMGRELGLHQAIAGKPGTIYYAHLDPASTSHNYALVILHVEDRIRSKENEHGIRVKEKIKFFVVDHIMAWKPSTTDAINVGTVDEYIIDLSHRFRFGMVSYDSWNSTQSIAKLRSKGIPSKVTHFRTQYKMHIYNHLEHLLINHQIALPPTGPWAITLIQELKHLKRIFRPTGFRIKPDPEAPITTDDCADALAGACGSALDVAYGGYPKSGIVELPQTRSGEQNQIWRIGQGIFTGNQWIHSRKYV